MRVDLPQRGLHLEYESHGANKRPPVILIMGLGLQLVSWPSEFIDALVAAGRRVIVFDNRDIGLSGSGPLPQYTSPPRALLAHLLHQNFTPPYHIADMAADTLALADALGFDRFDIVGVSLGGMIGQTLAARHPERAQPHLDDVERWPAHDAMAESSFVVAVSAAAAKKGRLRFATRTFRRADAGTWSYPRRS